MKKFLLGLFILLSFTVQAQYQKGGVMVVGGVAVMQLDTNARTIIKIIEDERVAGGGALFTTAEKQYVNYIVTNLKAIGVWDKCKAIYGFVGGTSASHKWNWKDMNNFNITWSGGVTHNSQGFTGDGTSGYGNTGLTPSVTLSLNNQGYALYIKDNFQAINNSTIGADDLAAPENPIINTNTPTIFAFRISSPTPSLSVSSTDKTGFFSFQRTASNNVEAYIKQTRYSNTTSSSNLVPKPIYVGAYNADGTALNFSTSTIKYIAIRESLSMTQSMQEERIITFAQGILGRK